MSKERESYFQPSKHTSFPTQLSTHGLKAHNSSEHGSTKRCRGWRGGGRVGMGCRMPCEAEGATGPGTVARPGRPWEAPDSAGPISQSGKLRALQTVVQTQTYDGKGRDTCPQTCLSLHPALSPPYRSGHCQSHGIPTCLYATEAMRDIDLEKWVRGDEEGK